MSNEKYNLVDRRTLAVVLKVEAASHTEAYALADFHGKNTDLRLFAIPHRPPTPVRAQRKKRKR